MRRQKLQFAKKGKVQKEDALDNEMYISFDIYEIIRDFEQEGYSAEELPYLKEVQSRLNSVIPV